MGEGEDSGEGVLSVSARLSGSGPALEAPSSTYARASADTKNRATAAAAHGHFLCGSEGWE
ncbi:hypothetical protein GCM10028793_30850 [Nocardiopsis oceani]